MSIETKEAREFVQKGTTQLSLVDYFDKSLLRTIIPKCAPNLDITRTTSECAVIRPESRIGSAESSANTWRLLVMYFPQCHRGTLPSQWSFIVQPEEKLSLYERLGGVYSIATVVDDFIDRIMVDPRLNANPQVNEAHHRVPPAGFKYLVTEMVCWATGGPQKIYGKVDG